jgi:hypothetical protein
MQRNDIVCFIPLAGFVLLLEVPFHVVGQLSAFTPNYTLIVVELGVACAVLLAGVIVTIGFLVHILRRVDFGGTQKAAWIAILLAAGPLGPPTYWFGVTRTPMNEKDRLEGRS